MLHAASALDLDARLQKSPSKQAHVPYTRIATTLCTVPGGKPCRLAKYFPINRKMSLYYDVQCRIVNILQMACKVGN